MNFDSHTPMPPRADTDALRKENESLVRVLNERHHEICMLKAKIDALMDVIEVLGK